MILELLGLKKRAFSRFFDCKFWFSKNRLDIGAQLSPQEEVNNGGDKPQRNEHWGYLALCTDPEQVVIFACFSIP